MTKEIYSKFPSVMVLLVVTGKTIDNVTHIIYGHNLSILGYDEN
jgi:hypothetical protein